MLLAWFWMSAIVYPYQLVADRLGPGREWWPSLNPMIPIITDVPEGALQPVRAVPLVHQLADRSGLVHDRGPGRGAAPCGARAHPADPHPRPAGVRDPDGPRPRLVPHPPRLGRRVLASSRCSARCGCSAGSRTTWPRRSDPMAHTAIEIDDVTKIFKLYREKAKSAKERVIRAGRNPYTPFYALRDISLEIAEGETLAHARPQRLGQVDAAQVRGRHAAPDHRAASPPGAGSPRCSSSAPASTPTSPGARTSSSTARSSGSPSRRSSASSTTSSTSPSCRSSSTCR